MNDVVSGSGEGAGVEAPRIYAPPVGVDRLSWPERLAILGSGLACLALLVVAAGLKPSPNGLGTHRGMGLEGCTFLSTTGLPCPSCGMTTSWVWFAHGNLRASFYVQPMGTVLAILAASTFWVALYCAATGRPVYQLIRVIPSRYYFVPLLSLAIAAWGWKIYIHLAGRDGWHY